MDTVYHYHETEVEQNGYMYILQDVMKKLGNS